MSYLFKNVRLKDDISQWDVSNMRGMFYFSNFKGDISEWDVSKVTDMSIMFANNEVFRGNLSKCNVLQDNF